MVLHVDDGGTAYTIHISHTGQVLNVRACAGVTTTTTTTTLPVNYYTFTDCNDVPVIGKAFLAGTTVMPVGTFFKGLYGGLYGCYKVSGTTTPGGPLLVEITFVYNSCFDCQKTLP